MKYLKKFISQGGKGSDCVDHITHFCSQFRGSYIEFTGSVYLTFKDKLSVFKTKLITATKTKLAGPHQYQC